MHSKHRRHEGARPEAPGHLLQDEEQQRNAERVQDQVHEMVTGRVQAEQLNVEKTRHGGHRRPVIDV
jgi:hypothetical protein